MNRRGFALLTVLWSVALASAVVGAAIATARLEIAASANRVTLTRAAWARDACADILLARDSADSALGGLDTVDLGRGTWCRVGIDDPGAKLNLNTTDPEALRVLLANDSLAAALLDWRDGDDLTRPRGAEGGWYRAQGRPLPRNDLLADVHELALIRGFDSARVARLEPLVTTQGTGQLNLGTAPPEVLATIPGMTDELIRFLLAHRAGGHLTLRLEEVVGALSNDSRRALLARYQDFMFLVSVGPTRLVATVEGGVHGRGPTAREALTLIPAPGRLAIVRRELE